MEGVSTRAAQSSRTLEFKGHLIDSLTLSKIADQIQAAGGQYALNDIRIGSLRKDISSVNLTVFAENEEQLNALLQALAPYGASLSGSANADVVTCQQDGRLPDEAFSVKLPQRVFYDNQWFDLNAGDALALVIDAARGEARLQKTADLRQGDRVVSGTHGVAW